MSDSNILKGALGTVGNLGKQIGKGIAEESKKIAKTAVQQVGLPETVLENENKSVPQAPVQDKDTQDFVKELYGASDEKPPEQQKEKAATQQQQQTAIDMAEANPEKTPEELQKMMALRQQLHGEYYQKLTTAQKRPEEAQEDQERASERVERLKMEDLQEEQKKKEKAKPLPQEARKTEAPMGAG